MVTGTVSALMLIYLSPTIQVDIFKHEAALFPLKNPALVTVPLSFLAGVLVSLAAPHAEEAAKFGAVERRALLGVVEE
jgi:cation/acetate symporter